MKILITGATGLIGQRLGQVLVKQGHEVVALVRDPAKAQAQLSFPATLIKWSHVHDPLLPHMWDGIHGVVHLMGENISGLKWTEENKKKFYDSRVVSTQNLISSLKSSEYSKECTFWIQGSAIGIYGYDDALGEGYLAELCKQWEEPVTVLPSTIRTTILRTGVVLSHRGGALSKIVPIAFKGLLGVLGSGKQKMSVIHLEDVIAFIMDAITKNEISGPINLVSETPVSNELFTRLLVKRLGQMVGPPVPELALKLLYGDQSELFLKSQSVLPSPLVKLKYPRLQDILNEIGDWFSHEGRGVSAFYAEQYIPFKEANASSTVTSLEELFLFFSDAKNLEKITPDFLNFKIKSMSTPHIEEGTIINYGLSLHGIPLSWKTKILNWNPPHKFVDNQESGPYSLWYHEHSFEVLGKGVLMKDWVRYELPLGYLGAIGGGWMVERDVGKIFDYRREVIQKTFLS